MLLFLTTDRLIICILAFNGIFNSTLFFPGFAVKKITFMQIVFTVTIYWTESLPLFSSKASCRLNVLTPLLVLTHVVVEHAHTNAWAAVGAMLSLSSSSSYLTLALALTLSL